MAEKNYYLEHTKPLFNEYKILNIQNLYALHTFMELLKIVKYYIPTSIFNLLTESPRDTNFLLSLYSSSWVGFRVHLIVNGFSLRISVI